MTKFPTKAVILARGLGTRMRADLPSGSLTPEQERVAASGLKALIPVAGGRTLLELIISNILSAGFTDICLVIGPEHDSVREYCAAHGLNLTFAVQDKALGTADAVLAAEPFVESDRLFLVVNSDNLYPAAGLRSLWESNRTAMLAFEREAMIQGGNITEDRIAKFATVDIDGSGSLLRIVEKPEQVERDNYISMNAWLFPTAIFDACRSIEPSERGEYEITAAVQYAIDRLGVKLAAIKTREVVLDLSSRADIEGVQRFLADQKY